MACLCRRFNLNRYRQTARLSKIDRVTAKIRDEPNCWVGARTVRVVVGVRGMSSGLGSVQPPSEMNMGWQKGASQVLFGCYRSMCNEPSEERATQARAKRMRSGDGDWNSRQRDSDVKN